MKKKFKAISLFSGAGGMDVGFKNAGFDVVWANEIDADASKSYEHNHPETHLEKGDIRNQYKELSQIKDIDVIFGGPPCQGFSVAGKMDPNDERNKLIWSFLDIVNLVKPKAFVMENVKALGKLEKWKSVREKIFEISQDMGYTCNSFVLNSAEFGVPQKRERVFFVGFLNKNISTETLENRLQNLKSKPKSLRDTLKHLGPAGTDKNPLTCTAKITFATNPVMRKSPYAGMLFNGMGRPLNIDELSTTLPASMGGNKTPIIDEEYLHGKSQENWIVEYHRMLEDKQFIPNFEIAPKRLRRLTIKEAALIQTFPESYDFKGSKSSIYRQIGNAVPCLLAQAVGELVIQELRNHSTNTSRQTRQLTFEDYITREGGVIDLDKGFIDIH